MKRSLFNLRQAKSIARLDQTHELGASDLISSPEMVPESSRRPRRRRKSGSGAEGNSEQGEPKG